MLIFIFATTTTVVHDAGASTVASVTVKLAAVEIAPPPIKDEDVKLVTASIPSGNHTIIMFLYYHELCIF